MGPHSPLPSHEGHPSTSNKSATEVCAQMAKPTMKSLAGCIFFVKKLHGTLCHEVFGRLLVPNALKVACLDATIWPIEFLKTSLATAKFEHFFDFRLLVFSLRWPSREANWVKNPYLSQVSLETPIFGGFYKDDTTQDVFLWISPSSSFFRQKFAKPLPCWALLWKKPLVLGQKEMTYWAMFGLGPVRLWLFRVFLVLMHQKIPSAFVNL